MWCLWSRSKSYHHYRDWTDLPFKSGRMHICRNALRTFYFKHMQGKSLSENSKRLFILPTLWRFFPDRRIFFLTTWKSYTFSHTSIRVLEYPPMMHSVLYAAHSSWALNRYQAPCWEIRGRASRWVTLCSLASYTPRLHPGFATHKSKPGQVSQPH